MRYLYVLAASVGSNHEQVGQWVIIAAWVAPIVLGVFLAGIGVKTWIDRNYVRQETFNRVLEENKRFQDRVDNDLARQEKQWVYLDRLIVALEQNHEHRSSHRR